METIWNIGITWNIFFQSLGNWLKTPMEIFSFLGNEYFFLLLLPTLYWCVEASTGLRIAIILLLSTSVNDGLKMAFHGPRPYWYSTEVVRYVEETSFGVPSGHAQITLGVWGMLAVRFRKWWGWLIAILIIFLVGLSRIYLGVHFLHDVLLGWLIGAILLWAVVRFWKPVTAWVKKLNLGQQILASFIGSLVLFLFPFIPFVWLNTTGWQPPSEWASFATQAVSLEGALTTAGTLFGLLTGLAWLNRQGGFSTDGPIWKRILRFILGVLGILVFYAGLKAAFGLIAPDTETALFHILRYIRYIFVGGWVSAGAPWLFIRLKLAEKVR